MEELRKILASGPSFVGLYLLLMVPTYILPYLGSNSLVANATLAAADAASSDVSGLNLLLFVHLACLGGLVLLAWLRGSLVAKTWIVALPIIAAVFDIVPGLSMIPLVPTALHITAIVVGVSGTPIAKSDL
ncbi:hypothetical protein J3454_06610 [Erythrobacter sp. NFXS35]|uniref:hypothetical protein n=1 Tax=Erythrobacter sp. NFXS35 TaxID=2818436 RepID=UPI0032DF98EA